MTEPRRRRRGSTRPAGPPPEPGAAASNPAAKPVTTAKSAPITKPSKKKPPPRPAKPGAGRDSERGWRDLAGNAPTQVGLSAALRARDVARPTEEQLAAAERDVVIVRRNYQPPAS